MHEPGACTGPREPLACRKFKRHPAFETHSGANLPISSNNQSFHLFREPPTYRMQTAAWSNPLKRQRSDQYLSKLEEASQPVPKKRKTICEVLPEQQTVHRDSALRRAPAPPTRGALRKPNAKKAPAKRESSRTRQLRRPAGRPRVTKCKESYGPRIRADIIEICGRDSYNEVKKFARHGGPDLQDLRGV